MATRNPEFGETFFSHPAISYRHQPNLKDLFETLTGTEDRFTLVFGAGVSLDAGLPSWPRLIDNIISSINDENWQSESRTDGTDLQRKAEYVIQLAKEGGASSPEDIIRNALYRKEHGAAGAAGDKNPGRLADAIARLCAWLGDRVDIVTTNFDTMLEKAIEPYLGERIDSVAFSDELEPGSWEGCRGVLHLHGILEPNVGHRGNIVLTESDFLRFGPKIRALLFEQIQNTHTIFVGVSMTDPNLVGPLWDFAHFAQSRGDGPRPALPNKCFMLAVASPNPASADPVQSSIFSIKKANYLQTSLGVRPVFFKSYGQQIQAVYEASLALFEPELYRSNDEGTSTRYGFRLQRALKSSYQNVGCQGSSDMPEGTHADRLSDRLYAAMHAPASRIQKILRAALARTESAVFEETYGRYKDDYKAENFALFLWLRSVANDNDAYDLRCVGSSAYRHREAWSLDRRAAITARSRFPVGRACFAGQADIANFSAIGEWQLWGSSYATPFSFYLESSSLFSDQGPFDSVEVGAIALHTTNFWSEESGAWNDKRRRSLLSTLTEDMERDLIDALASAAREIVTTPAH